jgi:hypothetical protein
MICWFIGHKPLELKVLNGPFAEVRDALGVSLVRVHLCERCKLVYWVPSQSDASGGCDAKG